MRTTPGAVPFILPSPLLARTHELPVFCQPIRSLVKELLDVCDLDWILGRDLPIFLCLDTSLMGNIILK